MADLKETHHVEADICMAGLPQSTEPGASSSANGKRKADSELDRAAKKNSPPSDNRETTTNEVSPVHNDEADADAGQPLSKNQLKRLRKQQQWQEYKEDRRSKRKDKRHERQARKRAEKEAKIAEAEAAGIDPATVLQQKEPWKYRPVPVSFIIDCDFERYMREQELVSLSSQLVRSYAMNRKSKYQASLHFSSWKGKLKDRFETVLKNTHHNWKNVGFHEGDFKEAAKQVGEQMAGPNGGEMLDLIKPNGGDAEVNPTVEVEPEGEDIDRSVVYLTSESPYTLDRLEANTSYVIGGIVDKNREKGLCYNRAKEFRVRTAKLPIGEYMAMQSRYVLTTNQVVEIMAKWIECGDWGQAFMDVIPKRKGGTLKGNDSKGSSHAKNRNKNTAAWMDGIAFEEVRVVGYLGQVKIPKYSPQICEMWS
ncbi:guanine-1-methyltransferase-domain-containing protein [Chaetomium tenue]|uniref:Guanine-1-methyltransferase-domain-containing protein n=1 Tax=Chaetomium tenue TaxID=1854479 RepID=A0ACB7P133_9PEZI|nr:guanine-1-methyltransferase-domain-containing protein [Chaetomium globosum]